MVERMKTDPDAGDGPRTSGLKAEIETLKSHAATGEDASRRRSRRSRTSAT